MQMFKKKEGQQKFNILWNWIETEFIKDILTSVSPR